jgi:surfeit locus 1 family protein
MMEDTKQLSQNLKNYWYRHLLVLLAVVVLVNLGLWQLRRLDQRRTLNRAIEAGLSQPPVALTNVEIEPDELHRRRVSVTGEFDNAESIILRGRSLNGQPGAELVVPLRLGHSDQAILINRGWIPLETSKSEARRIYDVEGEITVEGIAYRTQTRPDTFLAPTDPTPEPGEDRLDSWFRVDIDRIQDQLDYALAPIFIEQAPVPGSAALPLPPERSDLSDGPHLGYALQWFSFAVILIVLYAVFVGRELKHEE